MKKIYTCFLLSGFCIPALAQQVDLGSLIPVQAGDVVHFSPTPFTGRNRTFLTNVIRTLGGGAAAYGLSHVADGVGKDNVSVSTTRSTALAILGAGVVLSADKLAHIGSKSTPVYVKYTFYDKNLNPVASAIVPRGSAFSITVIQNGYLKVEKVSVNPALAGDGSGLAMVEHVPSGSSAPPQADVMPAPALTMTANDGNPAASGEDLAVTPPAVLMPLAHAVVPSLRVMPARATPTHTAPVTKNVAISTSGLAASTLHGTALRVALQTPALSGAAQNGHDIPFFFKGFEYARRPEEGGLVIGDPDEEPHDGLPSNPVIPFKTTPEAAAAGNEEDDGFDLGDDDDDDDDDDDSDDSPDGATATTKNLQYVEPVDPTESGFSDYSVTMDVELEFVGATLYGLISSGDTVSLSGSPQEITTSTGTITLTVTLDSYNVSAVQESNGEVEIFATANVTETYTVVSNGVTTTTTDSRSITISELVAAP